MINKMAINIHQSTIEFKKQNEQVEQKQTHRYREQFDSCQMREVLERRVKKVKDWEVQIGSNRIVMGM